LQAHLPNLSFAPQEEKPMEMTSPETVGLSSQRLHRIDALMQKYIDQQKLAGVMTVVARHGQIAHWECFGMMDVEANKPMQPDTILRMYSMTKPVTSVAVLMLYEEGHFLLDDPVCQFIPEFDGMKVCSAATATGLRLVEQERAMTIRDLLRHTSGLPYGSLNGSPVEIMYGQAEVDRSDRSLHEMVQALVTLPLICQPGSLWHYGLSTDVLGYLVEVIAGVPFDAFLVQRIFSPLGMKDTGFYVPQEKHARLSAVYEAAEAGGLARIDRPDVNKFSEPCRLLSGGAGLVSTAADYLRFAQMLLNGGELDGARLLSRTTVELMTRNHLPPSLLPFHLGEGQFDHETQGHGFGLGVRVMMDVAQSGVLGSEGEYGWGGAASTIVWIDPKEKMVCLLLPQFMPTGLYPIGRQFKVLAYQAIVD
jgi:CubicO group peptidase (beta-lactamase class C family)